MGWRESLRSASIDKIAFLVDSTEFSGGWNIDEKNIPVKEELSATANIAAENAIKAQLRPDARGPEIRDASKKAKIFNVLMHFIGDEYLTERNRVLDRFEKGGEMDLVLPTLGTVKCFVQDFRSTFNNSEGGFEQIDATFIAAPKAKQVITTVDTSTALKDGVVSAKTAIDEAFGYNVSDVADSVFEKASEVADALSGSVFDLIGLGEANNELTDFVLRIREFQGDIDTIIRAPQTYYDEIQGLLGGSVGIFDRFEDQFEAMKQMFDFGDDFKAVNITTPDRQTESDNQESVVFTTRALCSVQMAESASQIILVSVDQANTITESTLSTLDAISLEVADSNQSQALFDAIENVRSLFLNSINAKITDLPESRDIVTNENEPAIVLAYDMYADIARDSEIVTRNNVSNPLVCPKSLSVLSF